MSGARAEAGGAGGSLPPSRVTRPPPPPTVCVLSGEGPPHIQRGKDACVRAHACDHVHVCVRVQAWAGTRVSVCASVYHQEPQTDPNTWVLGAGQALLPVTCGAGLGRRARHSQCWAGCVRPHSPQALWLRGWGRMAQPGGTGCPGHTPSLRWARKTDSLGPGM